MTTLAFCLAVVGGLVFVVTLPSSNTDGFTSILFGSVYLEDLPDGIFKTLLTFFESLTSAFVDIFDFIGNTGVSVLGYSPLSIFIGAGLSAYLGYVAVKWLIGK